MKPVPVSSNTRARTVHNGLLPSSAFIPRFFNDLRSIDFQTRSPPDIALERVINAMSSSLEFHREIFAGQRPFVV